MATRECTHCGQTFDNAGNTVGQAIVAGCTHGGHLRAIPVQQGGDFAAFSNSIKKSLHQQTTLICGVLGAITSPVPVSSNSERDQHQAAFRTNLIEHYELEEVQKAGSKWGIDPKIKCMITGLYFPGYCVVAGHALSLRDRERGVHFSCSMTDDDIWDVRNGIVWLKQIEAAKEHLQVTVVPESSAVQTFRFRVLEDALWNVELPFARKSLQNPAVPGKGNATFGDLDGRLVQLPPLKPLFKRAWYRFARASYAKAIQRGQQCAVNTNLSEEAWDQLRIDIASSSLCGFPLEDIGSTAS